MKYLKLIFTPAAMGILFVIFALSMAVATFLENDFGSAAAYNMVYNSKWFELILILLSANLIGQLLIYRLFRKQKLPVAIFHLAFILMIVGAGITRYFGWEGSMHIREGESQDKCYSVNKHISYTITDNKGQVVSSHKKQYSLTSVSADDYKRNITVNSKEYTLELSKIIPNATEQISESPAGEPVVSLMITRDMMEKQNIVLKKGEIKSVYGVSVSFNPELKGDIT